MRSFEDSLQHLGLVSVAGGYKAPTRLRSEGVVGAIGVGINENDLHQQFPEHDKDGDREQRNTDLAAQRGRCGRKWRPI